MKKLLAFLFTLNALFCIISSLDLSLEQGEQKEIEKDAIRFLQAKELRFDSSIKRLKRGTTIVHHRVRKRRPKPLRRGRRPTKPRLPKPRPVYGPPSTQIHIHQPNYLPPPSFSSPSVPEPTKQNHNNFAEPPGPSAFSIPSAPPSSVPFPNGNSVFKKDVTQFQAQQTQSTRPLSQVSHHFGVSAQQPNLFPQDLTAYKNPIKTDTSFSLPVLTGQHPNIQSISPTSNTIISQPPSFPNTISQHNNNNFFQNVNSEIPTQSIPLDARFQGDLYRNTVSSYDVPINSFKIRENNLLQTGPVQTSYHHFSPPQNSIKIDPIRQYDVLSNNYSSSKPPPILPTRYEPSDFTAIQTKLSENRLKNYKSSDLFEDSSLEKFLNDVSESKRVSVKTRPEKKRSKPKSNQKKKPKTKHTSDENLSTSTFDNDDDDFSLENFSYNIASTKSTTTSTTKRPKQRRRKRPKITATTQQNLDKSDLHDAFESGSEVQEFIVTADDETNFEPKKYYKLSKTPIKLTKDSYVPLPKGQTSKPTTTTNYIFVTSPKEFYDDSIKFQTRTKTENPKHLKLPSFTYRPKRVRPTPQQPAIFFNAKTDDKSDEVKILSIQKAKGHNYHTEKDISEQNTFDSPYSFLNEQNIPDDLNSFSSGIYLTNGGFGTRIKHGRAKKDLESEEDYFFEAEYEIELPSNHHFYKK